MSFRRRYLVIAGIVSLALGSALLWNLAVDGGGDALERSDRERGAAAVRRSREADAQPPNATESVEAAPEVALPQPLGSVAGAVVWLGGGAVEGATVSLHEADPELRDSRAALRSLPGAEVARGRTGADGRYSFQRVVFGRYRVTLRRGGIMGQTSSSVTLTSRSPQATIDFTAVEGRDLACVVLDGAGRGVADVEVSWTSRGLVPYALGSDPGAATRATSNEDGEFTLVGLPMPSSFTFDPLVFLQKPGFAPVLDVRLRDNAVDARGRIVFRLARGRTLSLEVRPLSGGAVATPLVVRLTMQAKEYHERVTTDARGRAEVTGVPDAGQVLVRIEGGPWSVSREPWREARGVTRCPLWRRAGHSRHR